MSLVQHSFFPRSLMNTKQWFNEQDPTTALTTLDMFDPFNELDYLMGKNMQWLTKPEYTRPLMRELTSKYRVTLPCPGVTPELIKAEVVGKNLVVSASSLKQETNEDFSKNEFKKTFELPDNCELDKMISFVVMPDTLFQSIVIEFPLLIESKKISVYPKIILKADGSHVVVVECNMPYDIDESKVTVSIKDRDLIVKTDEVTGTHYFHRTTLPENTDFDHLKCTWEKYHKQNVLVCMAPLKLTTAEKQTQK